MAKVNNKPVLRSNHSAAQPAPVKSFIPSLSKNTDLDAMSQALAGTSARDTAAKPSGFMAAERALQADTYEVGQIYRLELSKFQKSENNARMFYLAQEIDDMSQSLSQSGQDTPAIGYVRNGKVVLTDGQKRFQACASAGLTELEVKIIEQPQDEATEYETSRRVNLMRSTQTSLDDAYRWKNLIDRRVYSSQDELAQRLGEKKEKVSKVIGITRIPERLVRMMVDHKVTSGWTVAYQISTVFDPKRVEELGNERIEALGQEILDEIIRKDMSSRQVEALIAKKLQGPQKRAQAESLPMKFGDHKGEMKIFTARGQLDLSFRGLPEQTINQLKLKIEQALQQQ